MSNRGFLALSCAAAFFSAAVPARADIDLNGSDPASRWVHSLPATCGFVRPATAFSIGTAMANDEIAFPHAGPSEWIRFNGSTAGMVRIRTAYDPATRTAAYVVLGTDVAHFGVVANAPPPPAGAAKTADLSRLRLAGSVHLGDRLANVTATLGVPAVPRPARLGGACAGYAVLGVCSWKGASCACPAGGYVADKRLGIIVFRRGRVVALAWDDGACGFG